MEVESSKDEKIIQAGFMMVKKELEKKVGRSPKKESTNKVNQDELLKKLKIKKEKNEEIKFDIYKLDRVRKYSDEIDPNKALKVIKEKLWTKTKDVKIINLAMVCHMKLENYDKALVEYKKGIYIEPENNDLNYNYIELKLFQKKIEEAYILLLKKVNKKVELEDLYLLGIVLYLKNQEKEALNKIVLALKKDKEYNRVYKFYTFISLLKKDENKIKISLKKLLEKDTKEMTARILLSDINLANNEKIEEEIRDEKYKPCIFVNRARYLMENGEYEKTNECLIEALAYNSNCICAKVEKSRLHILEKKYEEVYEELEQALKFKGNFLPLLNEILKLSYYLKKESMFGKIITVLKKKNPNLEILIYTKEKQILKIKIAELKENFYHKLKMLLEKYKDLTPYFSIELGNEMKIYQLFRDIRICEL